jgi:P27 family predicted phage terminase small subunit
VTTRTPRPPVGLSQPARRWWTRLVREYSISDPAGELLLETALRAFDRAEQARRLLNKDGCCTVDSKGRPKAHPAASVERDSRAGMLQALKALNLDVEPLRDRPGRPGGS